MRAHHLILPLAVIASPALAQQPSSTAPATQSGEVQIPAELSDPQLAGRVADMMQVLSKAFLNLPVGEMRAAAEGRKPTREERRMTVRTMGRKDDPNFERNLQRQIAESRPAMEAGLKAMVAMLPAMLKATEGMREELERAAANMPRPDYPKQ